MLKWLTLFLLVGAITAHPGVYDEYSYDEDENKEGDDGDYYLYYDEDESDESDIDDEELKKITDAIADYSYEDDASPQKGKGKGGGKGRKNKQNRQEPGGREIPKPRAKRFLDSLRLDKIIRPIIKEVFKSHPRPLNKEQRDKISGGYFGWQYAVLSEDCCSCKPDNTCSCCPSTNITGSDCIKFEAQPNRAVVSIDIGTHRHMEITVAKNSRSSSCEHANLKDICIYSDGFTPSDDGYKACVIVTNDVKDPKMGVLKCINYSKGQSTITDS